MRMKNTQQQKVSFRKVYRNGNVAWLTSSDNSWAISNDYQDKTDKYSVDESKNIAYNASCTSRLNWSKVFDVVITAIMIVGCSSILLYQTYYCVRK